MDEGAQVGEVNHILYADDAVVFCEANSEHVQQVLAILICFEAISSLKVNVHKSIMYPISEVGDGQRLADILGCSLGSFPVTYLGLPIGANTANKQLWDLVVTVVRSWLDSWKARFLSFGGRITLLKSVMSQLPIYYMSLFKAPVSVITEIERIQKRFLWEGCGDAKRPHLIWWEVVKEPKYLGGLGVLDLRKMNMALLGKWGWRFASEKNAWWRRLVVDKCGVGFSECL
ncbi:Putative ribonuclease H protein At1g65750 [Linum perenne]